jgi:hypothetical protein
MRRIIALVFFTSTSALYADESAAHVAAALEKSGDGSATQVVITLLPESILKVCAERDPKSPDWAKGVRVQLGGGTDEEIAKRPIILGAWKVVERRLCFEPRFPFLPDSQLRVTIDPPLLADPANGKSSPLVFDLRTPKRDLTPATKVEHIYPTRKVLPENQLRFYIYFSKPMQRGEAYDHVKLLDAKGKELKDVFLELGEELWDPEMKRFTLLFHPGRVKKGLQPREEFGPILEAGKSYTLVVSGKWKDGEGRMLIDKEYRKNFTAGPADDEPVNPKKWKTLPPAAGTKDALQVRFDEPLDHALLHRVIWVVDSDGKKVPGRIAVEDEETLWKVTPEVPWSAGKYNLVAETILEDLAANRIGRPFEVDILQPIPKKFETETVELPFVIKPPEPRK